MMHLHPAPRELGKRKTAYIGIRGCMRAHGEALRCTLSASPSKLIVLVELGTATAPAMPNAAGSFLDYASCCFPPCFPGFCDPGGEAKNGPAGPS
jgi:hypothetical protein